MSYQKAKIVAANWIAAAAIPEDMRGQVLELITFATDEDCRFFYPRRTLIWQQMVNTVIVKALRARKGRILRVVRTQADYYLWLGDRADTADARREFADSQVRLTPE